MPRVRENKGGSFLRRTKKLEESLVMARGKPDDRGTLPGFQSSEPRDDIPASRFSPAAWRTVVGFFSVGLQTLPDSGL